MLIPIIAASATEKISFSPTLLWSLAYLFLGILLGFIFGVPTIISRGAELPPVGSNEQQLEAKKRTEKIIQANTNLTQISDWLTKVIIGAGLVELKEIPIYIKNVAKQMGQGIQVSTSVSDEHFATVFSGGTIVLFSTYGFIFGYLIMRIILTEIFANTND